MALHDRLGIIVTIVAAAGALLAIASLYRASLLPTVHAYLRLSVVAFALQVLVGVVLVVTGSRPSQFIHWFYGAATLLTLPIAFGITTRMHSSAERYWIAGGAVLTVLFALRAIGTG